MNTPVWKRFWQRAYRLYAVRAHVRLGNNVHIGIGSILAAPHDLSVGNNTYIGKFCTVECDGCIGSHVMLANAVGIIGRYDHDYHCIGRAIRNAPWIGDPDYNGPGTHSRISIGDDVWIGYGAILLSGIEIGRGAIVAAGSVVTHNVVPYAIVAGNPARQVGNRFTPEEVDQHERLLIASRQLLTKR